MTALGILWYFLIFLLIAGYFVLDGFDLGVGILYPFLAKNEKDKALLRRSIGPLWDGNEVWLLTAGGALFAAFAPAYATTFSGFYLAIMLVLFGLILRGVAIEFAGRDKAWSAFWNVAFVIGSLVPALLFGVAVGNIYAGIPVNANGDYSGIPLLGLITPFTLLCGLFGLSMFIAAGASWLSQKLPLQTSIQQSARKMRLIFQILSIVLFIALSLYGHFLIQPDMVPELSIVRFACAGIFMAVLIVSVAILGKRENDLSIFLLQSLSSIAVVFLLATSMFPNLVVASAESTGQAITIANAASSDVALAWMTGIACIGVPLVLVYHFLIYRAFRGRLDS